MDLTYKDCFDMVRFFGLIPSVGLSQFDGPLFYVGIFPDQIALKYHYFYDPLLYTLNKVISYTYNITEWTNVYILV